MKRLANNGFSLLSLLVTIVIVGVLASLVIASISKATEKARFVSCLSNLRQIGVAFHAYLADHNGKYPPNRDNDEYKTEDNGYAGVHHQDSLKVYLNPYPKSGTITAEMAGVFWCPSDLKRKNGLAQHSYATNTYIGGNENANVPQNIRREQNPSKRLYLVDGMRENLSTSLISNNSWPFNKGSKLKPDTEKYVDFRHDDRANGLFVDGHVATFRLDNLWGQSLLGLIPTP